MRFKKFGIEEIRHIGKVLNQKQEKPAETPKEQWWWQARFHSPVRLGSDKKVSEYGRYLAITNADGTVQVRPRASSRGCYGRTPEECRDGFIGIKLEELEQLAAHVCVAQSQLDNALWKFENYARARMNRDDLQGILAAIRNPSKTLP